MIETKEQYQAYREGRDIVFFPVDGRRIVANSKNEAIETIEALRDVARAARTVVNEELHDWESQGYKSLKELDRTVNALSDWLVADD